VASARTAPDRRGRPIASLRHRALFGSSLGLDSHVTRGDADAVVEERPRADAPVTTRDRSRAASEPAARAAGEKRFSGAPSCQFSTGPGSTSFPRDTSRHFADRQEARFWPAPGLPGNKVYSNLRADRRYRAFRGRSDPSRQPRHRRYRLGAARSHLPRALRRGCRGR
jgi:hypothetical protein